MTIALVAAAGTAALGADGSLPGGTSLSVDVDEPADGLTIEVEDEDDTADVTVQGSASLAGTDATKNTTLIYVLDLSGSMTSFNQRTDCTGDGNLEDALDCQALAVEFLNERASDPASPVGWTGVATYSTSGESHNVDRDPDRDQDRLLVPPDYDGDGNGTPDLVDVVNGFGASGLTNFEAGLRAALDILDESTTPVNRLVFISDGQANRGNITNVAGDFDGFGTTRIDTFAITSGSGCDAGSDPLEDVALMGTEPGTCTEVEDLADLNFVLGQVLSSELLELEGSVNGGDAQSISDVSPELPEEGPVTVDFSWDVKGLAVGQHELCVTATGVDGGGEGDVSGCVTVTVEVPSEGTYPPDPSGTYPPEPEETEVLDEVIVSDEAEPAEPISAEPDFTG
ncbi:MAG: VWA domain-containing protein [Nitriliruptor sp.]|nr:MAG: VWA domain-containing protein [Nitriliruptor sp.]